MMPCRRWARQGAFITPPRGRNGMVFHWLFSGSRLLFDEVLTAPSGSPSVRRVPSHGDLCFPGNETRQLARSTTQNAPSTSKRTPIEKARPARTRAIPVNDVKMACSAQSVGDAGQPPRQTFETAIVERYRAGTFPSRRQTNNPMEPLLREACRRTKVLGTDPDGHPASMPVAAPLRHVSTTHWGLRRYMNMKSIGEMDTERAYSAA